jgi:hypothetical protein
LEKKTAFQMRKFFYSLFISLLFSLSALAQTEGISFQGLARNAAGEVLVSQKISLRLSILLDSESGTVAYTETRQVTTNPQGIFSLVVGDDKALTKSTNFSAINWTPSPKFIKVEMDPNAGANYLVMGTSRLQAVPFAFYANGVDASNVKGVLPVSSGGTGVASMTELKTNLSLDQVNNTSDASKPISSATQGALDTKVDKVTGKELSTNDYSTAEKTKLAAITGTNTGDQDLSGYATTAQLATKANSADVTTSLATKANTADVTTSLATKANTADVTTSLATKANASDVTTSLATKVDKVTGKDLSTNDYTTAEKTKLAAITGTNTGDQVNITGNAGTATKLQSSVTINGVAFDGSANITLPTPAAGIPYTGATEAVDLGAFDLKVNGITVGLGKNGLDNNVAIGKDALSSTTTGFQGNYITAVGYEALKNDTWGYYNTAIGSNTLSNNTTGLANTAIGSNSLRLNTDANYNTAVGAEALRNNKGNDNTASGASALEKNTTGQYNSAFGRSALKKNTTGSNNTATGINALENNTTGSENTAHGAYALQFNTTGRQNSAFGHSSLKNNTTGEYNTATGFGALSTNTTGTQNTATGWYALGLNVTGKQNAAFGWYVLYKSTGDFNTGVGESALKNNTTGNGNSAFGQDALANNSTGANNTAIGRESLAGNLTGSNNTALGAYSSVGSFTNATAIGYEATATADNMIRLGNGSVTLIQGKVGFTQESDTRIKKNIVNSSYGLATVLKLRPVEYNLTSNDLKQVGFIAQEVQKLVPEVVTGKEGDLSKGEILGITYSNLVPVLTKAIQEQQKQIEDQNAKIAAQQKQIEELIKLVKGQ